MRALLVEDEPQLAAALRSVLNAHGIIIDHVATIALAESVAREFSHDVMIIDRRLPDGEGLSIIRALRKGGNTTPALVLTARSELSDRVEGLDSGADDYLAKPFATEELLARIRALVRRPTTLQAEVVTCGRLSYDYSTREAFVDDVPIDLTRREHLVLGALLRQVGRMVSRETLMDAVFGMDDEVLPNALDTHVSRLRRKLATADSGVEVNGVRGVGFMLRTL